MKSRRLTMIIQLSIVLITIATYTGPFSLQPVWAMAAPARQAASPEASLTAMLADMHPFTPSSLNIYHTQIIEALTVTIFLPMMFSLQRQSSEERNARRANRSPNAMHWPSDEAPAALASLNIYIFLPVGQA